MNKLHLEYLRDTGKQAKFSAEEIWRQDKMLTEDQDIAVDKFLTNNYNAFDGLVTQEYVEWLENKVRV